MAYEAHVAAASGIGRQSSALTRGDEVEGQRYAWLCVSMSLQSQEWRSLRVEDVASLRVLTLLCSQRCEVFAFRLMAQGPCDEEAKNASDSVSHFRDAEQRDRAQKGCVNGINYGVRRLLRWLTHFK